MYRVPGRRAVFPAVAIVAAGLLSAACSMVGSTPVDLTQPIGCASSSGAYYLSKTNIDIEVRRWKRTSRGGHSYIYYKLERVVPMRKPDHAHGYCLDYIASPTTDEKIWVKKDADFLLEQISTQAIDQSAYALITLINAAGTLFSGIAGGDFRSDAEVPDVDLGIAFRAEYDPLDVQQSAVINNALREFGFCLVLEDQTFDVNTVSVESYCSNPSQALRQVPPRSRAYGSPSKLGGAAFDSSHSGRMGLGFRQPATRGVLYRPRVPYTYYLFQNQRTAHGSRWSLRESKTVSLENRSPIISVGVDRSYFANRRTALAFDKGMLRNICIYKSSEVEELAQIPLAIATNLAELPTNIIQLRIDNTNNFKKLTDVQDRLLKAQMDHANVLRRTGNAREYNELTQDSRPKDATLPLGYGSTKGADGKVIPLGKKTEAGAGFPADWDNICGAAPGEPAATAIAAGASVTAPSASVFQKPTQ